MKISNVLFVIGLITYTFLQQVRNTFSKLETFFVIAIDITRNINDVINNDLFSDLLLLSMIAVTIKKFHNRFSK